MTHDERLEQAAAAFLRLAGSPFTEAARQKCADAPDTLRGIDKTQADDELLPYATILSINGLDDALWCCRAEPRYARAAIRDGDLHNLDGSWK